MVVLDRVLETEEVDVSLEVAIPLVVLDAVVDERAIAVEVDVFIIVSIPNN